MEAYDRFRQFLFKWIRFIALALGHDIPTKDYTINVYASITAIHGVLFPFMYAWTIYNYDGKMSMQALAYFGNACQSFTKTIFFLATRKQIRKLILFITNVYVENTKTPANSAVFADFTKLFGRVMKLLTIECGTLLVAFVTAPGLLYMWNGSLYEPVIPMVIPGTSLNTTAGYVLNYVHQCYMMSTSGLGVYTLFALYFSLFILHVILLVDIMRNKLRFINQSILSGRPDLELKINLRNLILLHNETRTYVDKVKRTFEYVLASTVVLTTTSIALKIFAIFMMNLKEPAFYFLILYELIELGYFCAVGSVIDVYYNRIYEDLITSNWYLLPTDCKKPYILLLDSAKLSNNFKVLDMIPLNLNMYLMLLNRIYSISMVLRNIAQ